MWVLSSDGEKYFSRGPVTDAVPRMFCLLGLIYACLMSVGCLLVRDPPLPKTKGHMEEDLTAINHEGAEEEEEEALPPSPPLSSSHSQSYTQVASSEDDNEPLIPPLESGPSLTPSQLVRSRQAWHLSLSFGLGALSGLVVLG